MNKWEHKVEFLIWGCCLKKLKRSNVINQWCRKLALFALPLYLLFLCISKLIKTSKSGSSTQCCEINKTSQRLLVYYNLFTESWWKQQKQSKSATYSLQWQCQLSLVTSHRRGGPIHFVASITVRCGSNKISVWQNLTIKISNSVMVVFYSVVFYSKYRVSWGRKLMF